MYVLYVFLLILRAHLHIPTSTVKCNYVHTYVHFLYLPFCLPSSPLPPPSSLLGSLLPLLDGCSPTGPGGSPGRPGRHRQDWDSEGPGQGSGQTVCRIQLLWGHWLPGEDWGESTGGWAGGWYVRGWQIHTYVHIHTHMYVRLWYGKSCRLRLLCMYIHMHKWAEM